MRRFDTLTSAAFALTAGLIYAVYVQWAGAWFLTLPLPAWIAGWAVNGSEGTALFLWNLARTVPLFVLPGAALGWALIRLGRVPRWHYAWLCAAVPLALLVEQLIANPVRWSAVSGLGPAGLLREGLNLVLLLGSVPFFAWLLARRGQRSSK